MFRLLATLSLILAYPPAHQQVHGKQAEHAQAEKQPALPALTAEDANGTGFTKGEGRSDSQEADQGDKVHRVRKDRDALDWFGLLFSFGTLIVAAWAGYLAQKSLKTLVKQTKATRKSARAALQSADAVIAAERALLLFRVRTLPNGGYRIRCKNYGKLPARRLEITEPLTAVLTDEEFDAWTIRYPEIELKERDNVPPGVFFEIFRSPPRRWVLAPGHILAIAGEVRYDDGISPKRRHSRYLYVWDGRTIQAVPNGKADEST